jgi:hypothetical protein
MLVYEVLEEFMKTLETRPKDLQIAIEIKKEIKEGNEYTGDLLVHYIFDGYVHGYLVNEVASIQLLTDSFFSNLSYYVTEETVKKIRDIYEGKVNEFNELLKNERAKIEQVLASMGFTNIADIKLM